MAAVSSSNDAFRGGPCSRSPERIVKTYSGNCGSFRPRILPPQGRYRLKLRSEGFRRRRPMLRGLIFEALFPRSLVPPKPCAPEALCPRSPFLLGLLSSSDDPAAKKIGQGAKALAQL